MIDHGIVPDSVPEAFVMPTKFRGSVPVTATVWIYFIGPENGPIKIGYAQDPGKRVSKLNLVNPYPLRLWALVEGGRELEQIYHYRFAKRQLHGEWFTRCPEIEAEIMRLRRKTRRTIWPLAEIERLNGAPNV